MDFNREKLKETQTDKENSHTASQFHQTKSKFIQILDFKNNLWQPIQPEEFSLSHWFIPAFYNKNWIFDFHFWTFLKKQILWEFKIQTFVIQIKPENRDLTANVRPRETMMTHNI